MGDRGSRGVSPRTGRNVELGRRGEEIASEYLAGAGYTVLDRNWRCELGEIDIVARRGDEVVVVEVKTRAGVAFGEPVAQVTQPKLARLRRLAVRWLEEHRGSSVPHRVGLRLDVIGVLARPGQTPVVDHREGVA